MVLETLDNIVGLKLGADDQLTKPFDTLELMARIGAYKRRKSDFGPGLAVL